AVAALRARLWDRGWRPVALRTGDKVPIAKAWTDRARRTPPADAMEAPARGSLNTGILADGLRIVDIDVDEPALAHRVRELAGAGLGDPLARTRAGTGRTALLYRAAQGAPAKRTLKGAAGTVEVLGRGQQLLAYGAHPSGGALQWHPEPPDAVAAASIP